MIFLGISLPPALVFPARAQTGSWETPRSLGMGWFPDLAADSTGRVHVVWSSSNGEGPSENASTDVAASVYDVVMYASSGDGRVWSGKNDIAARLQGGGSEVTRPSILLDPNGLFHLTYRDTAVYYSHAPIASAATAQNWLSPYRISVDQVAYFSRMARDSHGKLHMVYTENVPNSGCPICYHVFYRWSEDNGLNWSGRTDILNQQTGAAKPQILIDPQDNIHVVWEAGQGGSYGQLLDPSTILYAVSYDGGTTWQEPVQFSAPAEVQATPTVTTTIRPAPSNISTATWGKNVTIGQDGNDTLMVVWLAPETDTVFYQVSRTQGVNWQEPRPIPNLWGGWAAYSARLDDYSLATDSAGNLHLALVGRTDPQERRLSLVHLVWDGSRWSSPEVVVTLEETQGVPEWPRLAIGRGNELHLAWFVRPADHIWDANPKFYEVWYTQGRAAAPRLAAVPYPTSTPPPQPTVFIAPSPQPPTPRPDFSGIPVSPDTVNSIYTEQDELTNIAIALVPTSLVVGVVIAVVRLRRRRG